MAYQHSWLFNAKAISEEEQPMEIFNPDLEGRKGVHAFPKSFNTKVNVIAQLVLELVYYNNAFPKFSHFTGRGRILISW